MGECGGDMSVSTVIDEVEGFYKVIALQPLRKTEGVSFDYIPMEHIGSVEGIDRVVHKADAISPNPVGEVQRPWYMHTHQHDNLLVLDGIRYVDIYSPKIGKILTFSVSAEQVLLNGVVLYDGPAMLVWPTEVFHRVQSCKETGSKTVNFAHREAGFDVKTAFNIYDVNTTTGEYHCIREGHLDQPSH